MATGLVLLVVIESKFTHGAWIILVLIPLLVTMFRAVNYHYRDMREQVTLQRADIRVGEHWGVPQQHKVVVPLSSLNRASLAALRFACSISQDVTAVVDVEPQSTARVQGGLAVLVRGDTPRRAHVPLPFRGHATAGAT